MQYMSIDAIGLYLTSTLLFYGPPLVEHIRSRIGGELNNGFDAIFDKLTKFLPWKTSKPATLQDAQAEIATTLQDDPKLQAQIAALLAEMQTTRPQLVEIVREFSKMQPTINAQQYTDNRGAHIYKPISIGEVNGDVHID